jgi:outer membrane protein OmpA-like peptidoglycan-associated protein
VSWPRRNTGACPRRFLRGPHLFLALVCVTYCDCVVSAEETRPIPLVAGLTITSAVSESAGDFETLATIGNITSTYYKMTLSGEAPDDSGAVREMHVSRNVRLEDVRASRILRRYFDESDPEDFPGTTPQFSSVMIDELRATGKTTMSYQDVASSFFGTVLKRTLKGSLVRVGPAAITVPILVNGKVTPLHAWHVAGRLSAGADADDFDFVVLDDPVNPLRLRSKGPGFTSSVLKIDFPVPADFGTSIEHSLAQQQRAIVYGIYFKFARADIRPESDLILGQIAAVLKKNPDWSLRIVGHTDNVGGDTSNLDLSRRRAAAVRAALVEHYGIDTARLSSTGYGASQPQEKNDSPEGRARNRRVELIRE